MGSIRSVFGHGCSCASHRYQYAQDSSDCNLEPLFPIGAHVLSLLARQIDEKWRKILNLLLLGHLLDCTTVFGREVAVAQVLVQLVHPMMSSIVARLTIFLGDLVVCKLIRSQGIQMSRSSRAETICARPLK